MRAVSGTLMLTSLLLQSQTSPSSAFAPSVSRPQTARLNQLMARAQPSDPNGQSRSPGAQSSDMQNAANNHSKLPHIQDRRQACHSLENFLADLAVKNEKFALKRFISLECDLRQALTTLSDPNITDAEFNKVWAAAIQQKHQVIRDVTTTLEAAAAKYDAQWPDSATAAKADLQANPVNVTQVNAQLADIVIQAQQVISNSTKSLADLSLSVTDFQDQSDRSRVELQAAFSTSGRIKDVQTRLCYERTPNPILGARHHLDSDIQGHTGDGETVLPIIQEALRDTVLANIPQANEGLSAVDIVSQLPREGFNPENLAFEDFDLDPAVKLSLAKIVDKLTTATEFKSAVSAIQSDVRDVNQHANRFVDNKLNSLYSNEDSKNLLVQGLNVLVKMIRRTMTGLNIQAQDGRGLFQKTPSVTASLWGNVAIAGGKEHLSLTRSGFSNKLSLSTQNGLANFIMEKLANDAMENTDDLEQAPTYVLATLKYVERLSPRQKAELAQDLAEIMTIFSKVNDEGIGTLL